MYVELVSVKICLSINDLSKCGGEYNIARKVDIVHGLICSYPCITEYLNLCNKINKSICMKLFHHMFLITNMYRSLLSSPSG